MRSRNPTRFDWRAHRMAEGIALAGLALAGAAVAAWRANQRAETDLNARTWARLLPPQGAEDGVSPS